MVYGLRNIANTAALGKIQCPVPQFFAFTGWLGFSGYSTCISLGAVFFGRLATDIAVPIGLLALALLDPAFAVYKPHDRAFLDF